MQPAFDIDEIGPTGIGDIWKATLTVRLEDKIDGEIVYQVMSTTVRFSQKASEPISGMLDKARIVDCGQPRSCCFLSRVQ